jgi:hypothetical protein
MPRTNTDKHGPDATARNDVHCPAAFLAKITQEKERKRVNLLKDYSLPPVLLFDLGWDVA